MARVCKVCVTCVFFFTHTHTHTQIRAKRNSSFCLSLGSLSLGEALSHIVKKWKTHYGEIRVVKDQGLLPTAPTPTCQAPAGAILDAGPPA